MKDYQIISELGHGGMATVFLAHDNKFDTNVAVKVLSKEFVHNDNIRKRFLAEARSMFKMSHPNIIKVSDLIDQDGTVAFVMEYIEGETLKDYLDSKGKLSDEEIKNIFTQMLEAVEYVHKQQLVHRDIKPSNFMINQEGQIKLMDFGIAKTTDASSAEYTQTGTGVQMGTPMYMSPEQITESKAVTAQSDIYSLGVVLWQMVTGQKPYDTKSISSFQLQIKIVNEPLENTNSRWDDLIQMATTKDMASRLMSANAFKMALNSKNDNKAIESDSTILNTDTKQDLKPETSSKLEAKVNNEKVQPREEVRLHASKKSFLPVIIIAALCITAIVVYLVYNPVSSSNYQDAEKAKADSINATDDTAITADSTPVEIFKQPSVIKNNDRLGNATGGKSASRIKVTSPSSTSPQIEKKNSGTTSVISQKQKRIVHIFGTECGDLTADDILTNIRMVDGVKYTLGDKIELSFGVHKVVEILKLKNGKQYRDENSILIDENTNNYETFSVVLNCL